VGKNPFLSTILWTYTTVTDSLVLDWLAWRSRSIATSMAAHGVANGLGFTLGYLVAAFRL